MLVETKGGKRCLVDYKEDIIFFLISSTHYNKITESHNYKMIHRCGGGGWDDQNGGQCWRDFVIVAPTNKLGTFVGSCTQIMEDDGDTNPNQY